MCIYFERNNCFLFFCWFGVEILPRHRNESKELWKTTSVFCLFVHPCYCHNQRSKKKKKSTLSQDWVKETEGRIQRENRREGIKWAQVSNKKSMTRFSWPIQLVEFFVSSFSSSAGRCVWCAAIFHVKQWLFQDSLIRRLVLPSRPNQFSKRKESGKRWGIR